MVGKGGEMKNICLGMCVISLCVVCAGCDVLTPNVSKAQTEKKQLVESTRQNDLLERIAVALEKK